MTRHFLVSHYGYMRGLYYRACDSHIPRSTRGRNKKQGSFKRKDVNCGKCKRTNIFNRPRKANVKKILIHRVSCRGCDEIFNGVTPKEAEDKHRQHIKTCQAIIALQKVERFRKKAEKILGRKVTFLEAAKLVGVKQ